MARPTRRQIPTTGEPRQALQELIHPQPIPYLSPCIRAKCPSRHNGFDSRHLILTIIFRLVPRHTCTVTRQPPAHHRATPRLGRKCPTPYADAHVLRPISSDFSSAASCPRRHSSTPSLDPSLLAWGVGDRGPTAQARRGLAPAHGQPRGPAACQ